MIFTTNDLLMERYKIIKIIGQGGMGEVYKAFDENIHRYVAIKTFRGTNKLFSSERLQRQVEILSNLKHPNISSLYDIGFYEGVYFIVQEYIYGDSLNNFILNKKLSFEDVINYSKDILEALVYLHQNNIIHRDMKPSNIIINQESKKICITDFDICKFIDNTDKFLITTTQAGFFVGTPAFASPEQIENKGISDKVDIYSLGIIIYEMLTGQLPFNYKSMKDIYNRVNESYKIELKGEKNIQKNELSKLINSMLSLNTQERPSAKEALETLNNLYRDNNKLIDININEYRDITESVVEIEKNEAFELHIESEKVKSGTGFFCDEEVRKREILVSRNFYRTHLNNDYKTLLFQAKISFWLWALSLIIGFGVVIVALLMVYKGNLLQGGALAVGEAFIYILQNIFKIREDHYRKTADQKNKHLEIGNYWNLITQSIDVIEDRKIKNRKLIEVIDSLNSHIYSNDNKNS